MRDKEAEREREVGDNLARIVEQDEENASRCEAFLARRDAEKKAEQERKDRAPLERINRALALDQAQAATKKDSSQPPSGAGDPKQCLPLKQAPVQASTSNILPDGWYRPSAAGGLERVDPPPLPLRRNFL